MEKYNISNFYIGRLSMLSHHTENLLASYSHISEEDSKNIDNILFTKINGAIRLTNQDYFNWGNHNHYDILLTIFNKIGEKYVCLHNGLEYNLSRDVLDGCCFDLKNLTEVFPKFNSECHNYITIREALKYFDRIANCNEKTINKFYRLDEDKYSLEDFYVGTLNLYSGFHKTYGNIENFYTNVLEGYLLTQNSIWKGCFGVNEDKDEYGLDYNSHSWNMFTSLFVKLNRGVYNIHNFTTYQNGTLENTDFKDYEMGDSFFDHMKPLIEILERDNIKYPSKDVSINKVLKLYKKVNK